MGQAELLNRSALPWSASVIRQNGESLAIEDCRAEGLVVERDDGVDCLARTPPG